MAVARVAGYPDFTFDGASKNIPLLFSGKCLEKLYENLILTNITHTDYVGEVQAKGDKVIIRTIPTMTIKEYEKGKKLELEHPESPNIEFTVDYADYFAFAMDDIDIKQFDIPMMDKYASDAAFQMKKTIETRVFATIYSQAHASNIGLTAGKLSSGLNFGAAGTPLTITKTNVLDVLVDIGQALDEQNVPETDRWIIIPPWMQSLIKKSELRDASITGDSVSPVRNGLIGRIDRLTLYNSNLLHHTAADGGCDYILWGHKMALAFVTQLSKVETYRPQDTFANAMKGLNVSGFKVIQEAALGYLYAKKG